MSKYMRKIMPFVNENRGYAHRGNQPAGRCILESSEGGGKLTLWIQNLQPETLYKAHLIFAQGNGYAGLPVCNISPNANGRAKQNIHLDAGDLEKCIAVAVLTSKNDAPLCAYKDEQVPWHKDFALIDKRTEEVTEAEPQAFETLVPQDPDNLLSDAFKEEVESMIKTHTHMQPFEKQSRDVEWMRISLNEDLSLPDYICELLNEPFVKSAFNQYNHLILGKAVDEGAKRYYIGIPALYDSKDKIVGFRQFKSSEDKEPQAGDYGYWLVFMA